MPFEISYDDMKFHVICIATTGSVSLADSFQNNNKVILYGIPGVTKGLNEVETIVDDSYVAIRWPCLYFIDKNEMELGECAILLMIINRDGTVTYFFEKVPMDFDKSKFHLLIYNGFYHLSPDGVESITIRDKLHGSITNGSQITSGSSYKVTTYPACSHQKTCSTCFTKSHPSQNCIWCPTVSRCEYSQNVDNSRSTEYECSITDASQCPNSMEMKTTTVYLLQSTKAPTKYRRAGHANQFSNCTLIIVVIAVLTVFCITWFLVDGYKMDK
ncbi:Immunogenic miracidial antigen 8I [Schistosoma japonicum]|nr:Immunogenic miracidial antigen 8I [Schistosoma japonicum]